MPKRSITEHATEVVLQHQVPCGDCAGPATTRDGAPRCGRCRGTGRVGNCSECNGRGFFSTSSYSRGWLTHSGRSCCPCGGKGWVGNCAPCKGLGKLEGSDCYVVCPTCRGHGHLDQRFYTDDSIHGLAVVRIGDAGQFLVPLGEAPVIFGRQPPYAFVRLFDALMTKRHFEIHWHPGAMTHDVFDYGRYSLRLNGEFLAGAPDRVRLCGDEPSKGDRRQLADRNVLQIGQYLIEYIAHLDHRRRPAG
jgi:RecJ-like exonuclease